MGDDSIPKKPCISDNSSAEHAPTLDLLHGKDWTRDDGSRLEPPFPARYAESAFSRASATDSNRHGDLTENLTAVEEAQPGLAP